MLIGHLSDKFGATMSRSLKDFRLNDRAARSKLVARPKPYWRLISDGCHLGYRSSKTSGSWIARFRERGSDDDYKNARLGAADDRAEANGDTILSWSQALGRANEWFVRQASQARKSVTVMSVREAVEAYIAIQDVRASERAGKQVRSVASSRLQVHVLNKDDLASIMLDRLREEDLRAWLAGIVGIKTSSKKRACADFKAALNAAFAINRSVLPGDLKLIISEGLKIHLDEDDNDIARENQILDDDTVRRLVASALEVDEDLGRLVLLLAATGARFSQLQRMLVRDVQIEQSRLMMPSSRKGRSRKTSHYRVQIGADVIQALIPAVTGRRADAVLLERW